MKTISAIGTASLLLAICFISCQRESDFTFGNTSVQGDSTYLARYITIDTTLPPGSDTIQRAFLTYDNSKRLSQLHAYTAGGLDTVTYTYKYSGTDSLPHTLIERGVGYNGPGTSYIDTIFFTYDNGMVKSDSSIQWIYPANSHDETIVHVYSVTGGTARVYTREYGYIGSTFTLLNFDSSFYSFSFNSGNLSSLSLLSGVTAFFQSVQVLYDNKPNPLGKAVKIRFSSFENDIFNEWNFQNNNPLSVQYQQVGNPPETEQYTYKYRADGYPVSATYFESLSVSNFNKVLFYYTAL